MSRRFMTPTEVLNDHDKTFGAESSSAVESNTITVTLAAVEDKKHYIGSVGLIDTTGTGGAESLKIKIGSDTAWEENFTIGTDKVRQFQAVPLVGGENEAVTVEASATDLTAGKLYVIYYTK